jgi:hypothetical protein
MLENYDKKEVLVKEPKPNILPRIRLSVDVDQEREKEWFSNENKDLQSKEIETKSSLCLWS